MRFTEQHLLEDYLIEELSKKGWNYIPGTELAREDTEEPLLIKNLEERLYKINEKLKITNEELRDVINELKAITGSPKGQRKLLDYIKRGIPVKFAKEKVVKYVKLIDYGSIKSNELIVSNQIVYKTPEKPRRLDIILFVNGIPIVNIECKNPADPATSWEDAYSQIHHDYKNSLPELYKYIQVGVAADATVKYFPIVPWLDDVCVYQWIAEGKDPVDAAIEMLSPEILLDLIRFYFSFREFGGSQGKVISKYMQYRASEKIVKRVRDCIRGINERNRGLIWHWQGSGKTLSMIFSANKLYQDPLLENPSIFFIVDRDELEEQLIREFGGLDVTGAEVITSINNLKECLKHDGGKGKRGLFIVLIHKFSRELEEFIDQLNKSPDETIMNRENVILFLDEAHRTQSGILASQMRSVFRKAFMFAFTGTPISIKERNTYKQFSYLPDEPYLDRYFITESIHDGTTLKIAYKPAPIKDVRLRKEELDAFLEFEDEEIPEETKETLKKEIKSRLNSINAYLENEKRIKKKAEFIAKDFECELAGKFKAMIVAPSRKACIFYKRHLDRFLDPAFSEIVMTYGTSRDRETTRLIEQYFKGLSSRYKGLDENSIRKKIISDYKDPDKNPQIVIVTNMLLTGFDVPHLHTMYLDKPMKGHTLLQSIARTNRPYHDYKECGLVIDFIGILDDIKKAFKNYSDEEMEGVLWNTAQLKKEFVKYIEKSRAIFETINDTESGRDLLVNAFEVLSSNPEAGKNFVQYYRRLRRLFQLLSSDSQEIEHKEEFRIFSKIYAYYTKLTNRDKEEETIPVQKYFNKTIEKIHKSTDFQNIIENLPTLEIDEDFIEQLNNRNKSMTEKAANIVFALRKFVLVDKANDPVYESIAGKVEKILTKWKEKSKNVQLIFSECEEIYNEIVEIRQKKKRSKMNDLEYSIVLLLKGRKDKSTFDEGGLIKDVRNFLSKTERPPGWQVKQIFRKNVESSIRKFLRKFTKSLDEIDTLSAELMRVILKYG